MTHAPLVCDLAVAIADVLFHGRDNAIDAGGNMIAGYVAVTPLDDGATGLLADLVAARLATDITLTTWRPRGLPRQCRLRRGQPGRCAAFLDSVRTGAGHGRRALP